MSNNTGGPAFPTPRIVLNDDGVVTGFSVMADDMTLRDYFAAKAMHAFLMRPASMTAPDEVIAEAAYDTADAMLKAREASK